MKRITPTHVVYHRMDLDGVFSGAIMAKKYPNAVMIGWDYRDPLDPILEIPKEAIVVFVDVTPPAPVYVAKIQDGHDWYIIDHHKSFLIEIAKILQLQVQTMTSEHGPERLTLTTDRLYMDTAYSAAELCWNYAYYAFAGDYPPLVEEVAKYDVFRNRLLPTWDETTMPIQYALRAAVGLDIGRAEDVLHEPLKRFLPAGEAVVSYIKTADNNMFQLTVKQATEVLSPNEWISDMLHGVPVYVSNSKNLQFSYLTTDPDGVYFFWQISAGKCVVELRRGTNCKLDLSELAKALGGGGHAGAAGFVANSCTIQLGDYETFVLYLDHKKFSISDFNHKY